MEKINLSEIRTRLGLLAVFRELLDDTVIAALCRYLELLEKEDEKAAAWAYAQFVSDLYAVNGGELGQHISSLCDNSANIYVRMIGSGITPSEHLRRCVDEDICTLQAVAELTPQQLHAPLSRLGFWPEFGCGGVDLAASFAHRVENIGKYGYGLYAGHHMFYVDEDGAIIPVKNPDTITLDQLVDYESERAQIVHNTRALLEGLPAANILLTGDAGTGKSSTVKAVGNALFGEGLRIIEVRKDQLRVIPRLLDELANNPLKFVLFIDDLSFLRDDDNFNALKAVLEGSVSARSKNVVIYATSNRRHLIKEKFSDREGDDIHRNDTMQELVSLSERFGLHVSFSKPNKATYLHMVRHFVEESELQLDDKELELLAERFALERGGRSARLARQFVDALISSNGCK